MALRLAIMNDMTQIWALAAFPPNLDKALRMNWSLAPKILATCMLPGWLIFAVYSAAIPTFFRDKDWYISAYNGWR